MVGLSWRRFIGAVMLAAMWACPAQAANLIINGGFESRSVQGSFVTITAGSSGLPGWTVVSGSVDVVGASFFPPFEGAQSLDLDGNSPGTIQQSFATSAGTTYDLMFEYANNGRGGTVPATGTVSVTGSGSTPLLSQSLSHGTSSVANMNYTLFTAMFTANSSTTTLVFTSTDPSTSNGGLVLDAISTSAVPEPACVVLLSVGVAGLAVFRRARASKWRK